MRAIDYLATVLLALGLAYLVGSTAAEIISSSLERTTLQIQQGGKP